MCPFSSLGCHLSAPRNTGRKSSLHRITTIVSKRQVLILVLSESYQKASQMVGFPFAHVWEWQTHHSSDCDKPSNFRNERKRCTYCVTVGEGSDVSAASRLRSLAQELPYPVDAAIKIKEKGKRNRSNLFPCLLFLLLFFFVSSQILTFWGSSFWSSIFIWEQVILVYKVEANRPSHWMGAPRYSSHFHLACKFKPGAYEFQSHIILELDPASSTN